MTLDIFGVGKGGKNGVVDARNARDRALVELARAVEGWSDVTDAIRGYYRGSVVTGEHPTVGANR